MSNGESCSSSLPILNWEPKHFGSCAELVTDKVHPEELGDSRYVGLEHIEEESLALIDSGNASDVTSTKSRFKRGDILFGKLRPYFRKLIRAPFDGICSTDIWVVRSSDGVEAGFLFYLMASERFIEFAMSGSQGTRMPRAKWEFVARLPIELPPLEQQRKIARVLGALDEKIKLNRRVNETLEAIAQAIFKDWFVDFGPVRAKEAGTEPYLPSKFWVVFPDKMVKTETDFVPATWRVRSLGECFDLTMGQSPPGTSYNEVGEGIPFFQGRTDFGFRYPVNRRFSIDPKAIRTRGRHFSQC